MKTVFTNTIAYFAGLQYFPESEIVLLFCIIFIADKLAGFYEQNTRRRQIANVNRPAEVGEIGTIYEDPNNELKNNQWRRVLLLVVAITVSGSCINEL